MAFLSFLSKKKFYINLGISVAATVLLFFITFQFLKIYTGHSETYVVPDFYGMTLEEARAQVQDDLFEFIVIDSVYDPRNKKEAIVIQNPLPGSLVKKDRKIYITTVAKMPEKVEMPDLIDLSLRQAINRLKSKGLKINKLDYVEDFADNAVLEQVFEDEIIEPGTMIEKGSGVDLILGLGSNDKVPVPLLIGMTRDNAIEAINRASFNIGSIHYYNDTATGKARVYRQRPDWNKNATLLKGQQISIWLRSDDSFNFEKLLEQYLPDTTSIDTAKTKNWK